MGHSLASLYRYASMGCPLTNGSLGSCSSRGTISVWELVREAPDRDTRVLARVRNSPEPPGDVDVPIEGDGSESPVPVGEFGPLSDWKD